MAHIQGVAAQLYAETVQPVVAATPFAVGSDAAMSSSRSGLRGFTGLANADTINYFAQSRDDPSRWELGLGTYSSSALTLTRTTVLASSNAGSAVDFTAGNSGPVLLQAAKGLASGAAAYAITSMGAGSRTILYTETVVGNVAAVLATLITDLKAANVLR